MPTVEEFVAARGEALLRFALMLCGDRRDAEDLTQSVLARAIPRWARICAMEQPEAYLKKMLVNEYLRWRRRRWHREVPTAAAGAGVVRDTADAHASRDAASRSAAYPRYSPKVRFPTAATPRNSRSRAATCTSTCVPRTGGWAGAS